MYSPSDASQASASTELPRVSLSSSHSFSLHFFPFFRLLFLRSSHLLSRNPGSMPEPCRRRVLIAWLFGHCRWAGIARRGGVRGGFSSYIAGARQEDWSCKRCVLHQTCRPFLHGTHKQGVLRWNTMDETFLSEFCCSTHLPI